MTPIGIAIKSLMKKYKEHDSSLFDAEDLRGSDTAEERIKSVSKGTKGDPLQEAMRRSYDEVRAELRNFDVKGIKVSEKRRQKMLKFIKSLADKYGFEE